MIPPWFIDLGAILAVLLTALRIREFLKTGHLDVRLTREMFFRITDHGESIFTNAVFLCRWEPVEIRSVGFELTCVSGSTKTYAVEPIWIGAKLPVANNVYAQHSFSSKSAATFLAENTTRDVLYLCALSEYSMKIREAFIDLERAGTDLARARQEITTPNDANVQALYEQTLTYQRTFVDRIVDGVQVETGTYRLRLVAKYRHMRRLWAPVRECRSEIELTIGDGFREAFRQQVAVFAHQRLLQAARGEARSFPLPEHEPLTVKEV
jgi:hypothetical protein